MIARGKEPRDDPGGDRKTTGVADIVDCKPFVFVLANIVLVDLGEGLVAGWPRDIEVNTSTVTACV